MDEADEDFVRKLVGEGDSHAVISEELQTNYLFDVSVHADRHKSTLFLGSSVQPVISPRGGERPARDIHHSKETAASLSSNQDFTRLASVCACTCIYNNC